MEAADFFYQYKNAISAFIISRNYKKTLARLKKRHKQYNVGFFVSEIAKWKGQSFFELLVADEHFRPQILIYPSLFEQQLPAQELVIRLKEKEHYFLAHNMDVSIVWDITKNKCTTPEEISCDLLFYQQPWDISVLPNFFEASRKSLTFYYPYYLVNYYVPRIEIMKDLQKRVFCNILLNSYQADLYSKIIDKKQYAGTLMGLGHPILDRFYIEQKKTHNGNLVIYAPHFSVIKPNTENTRVLSISTFLETGIFMLDYAKQHRDVEWIFKPHPRLREELVRCNIWTKDEVDAYYDAWEQIGTSCYTADYIDLFLNSKALITDCGSFLTEFSCTNKPIIRMIPQSGKTPANPALESLYSCFYEANGVSELGKLLDQVVLMNNDPLMERRMEEVAKAHLADTYSSKNILEYLYRILLIKDE